jgi:signal transduction histidine kinase
MIVLTTSGVVGAGSLIWITTALDRTAEGIFHALDGVRVCEELRLQVLLLARSEDRLVREHLEDRLRTLGQELEAYALPAGGRSQMREVQQALELYLEEGAGAAEGPNLAKVFTAIDHVADLEAARARALRQHSARLDTWANRLGGATALLLALGIPLILIWLRFAIVRPVLQLSDSIQRYAHGDRTARARVSRPIELREIGERFNELADALATRRREEMAFLGAVAHDIRNPLSVLSTSLAALADRPVDAQTERLFGILARQIEQIGRLVSDLLDAAQLEAVQLPFRMETCDLCERAREVGDLYALRSDADRIELCLPEAPVLVQGDPSRINQALTNLVGNALKYSPKDSVVEVKVQRVTGAAEVSVTDHGPGISSAAQTTLFEPFRRVAGAEHLGPGAGLGLFIADQIARAHGGRIQLDSQPGQGSTFRLRFPVSAPPA